MSIRSFQGNRLKPSTRRKVLLDTASKLFNQFGFHPTGIDLIIKESGTSKATLYNHFKNKETLILEVLKSRQNEAISNIKIEIKQNKSNEFPILTIFDIYHDWFQQTNFYGCFFQKASSEFSDEKSSINQYCVQAKNELFELITSFLQQQNHDLVSAKVKARGLMILLDGSIIDAQISKNKNAAIQAKDIAHQMLEA